MHPLHLHFIGIILLTYTSTAPLYAENVRTTPPTHLANPASVYCHKQGGILEIKSDRDGNQYGLCHLPDGSVCEEWAFFRDNTCVNPEEGGEALSY